MEKKRIVEIKTIKGIVIRKLFEVIKQFIKDANLVFNSEGMKMSFIDPSENSFTFLKLHADKFELFKCEKEVSIGVNISTLFKTLKSAIRREIITMYVNEGEEESFYIEFYDPFISKSRVFKLEALILRNDDANIQPMSFESVINISTSQFQQIIKDIKLIEGKIVDIKSVNKRLIISSVNGLVDFTSTIKEMDQEGNDELEDGQKQCIKFNSEVDDKIVQGKFKMSYLLDFIKASHLCENMNILISNDKPMILEYFVADLGVLRFVLIPL
jgi:proliferating cell nuclear antigen